MIGSLKGQLTNLTPPTIVLEVNGVGYALDVPMSTFCKLPQAGETIQLLTHLLVKEDALLLYGFLTEEERQTFKTLLKLSGVGARSALAILSSIGVHGLIQAVVDQSPASLTQVPGIGKKTAARLILELKDRLGKTLPLTAPSHHTRTTTTAAADAQQALSALGYNDREIHQALQSAPAELDTTEFIRFALKQLSQ